MCRGRSELQLGLRSVFSPKWCRRRPCLSFHVRVFFVTWLRSMGILKGKVCAQEPVAHLVMSLWRWSRSFQGWRSSFSNPWSESTWAALDFFALKERSNRSHWVSRCRHNLQKCRVCSSWLNRRDRIGLKEPWGNVVDIVTQHALQHFNFEANLTHLASLRHFWFEQRTKAPHRPYTDRNRF